MAKIEKIIAFLIISITACYFLFWFDPNPQTEIPPSSLEQTTIRFIDYDYEIEYIETKTSRETKHIAIKYLAHLNDLIHSPGIDPTFKKQEIQSAANVFFTYKTIYKEQVIKEIEEAARQAKWEERAQQYPIATKVWLYMKENFGWSDVVCAGVMGNIMGEIGGGVLGFTNWDHDAATYGMFQWLGGRKKDLKRIYGNKPTIEEQLEFMYDELYGTDGVRKQVTNKQRDKILNGKTPEEVAMAFCRYFERPGGTGLARKGYARKAYNYFAE